MPLVDIQVIAGVFDAEQKRQMIKNVTDAMEATQGPALRGITWVRIHEYASGDWGIGGVPLSAGDVRALAATAPNPPTMAENLAPLCLS